MPPRPLGHRRTRAGVCPGGAIPPLPPPDPKSLLIPNSQMRLFSARGSGLPLASYEPPLPRPPMQARRLHPIQPRRHAPATEPRVVPRPAGRTERRRRSHDSLTRRLTGHDSKANGNATAGRDERVASLSTFFVINIFRPNSTEPFWWYSSPPSSPSSFTPRPHAPRQGATQQQVLYCCRHALRLPHTRQRWHPQSPPFSAKIYV